MLNWHARHQNDLSLGDRVADAVAGFIGSWFFIILQSCIFLVWVVVNTLWYFHGYQWDPYPFILFNLFMSAEAAYSSPLILMSQNRQTERDRYQAEADYETNRKAKEEIEELQMRLNRIEVEKLDRVISLLEQR